MRAPFELLVAEAVAAKSDVDSAASSLVAHFLWLFDFMNENRDLVGLVLVTLWLQHIAYSRCYICMCMYEPAKDTHTHTHTHVSGVSGAAIK